MIFQITYDGDGHKVARPVKNRQELLLKRNSKHNLDCLAKAQQGDQAAKGKLLQLAYNLGYAEGKLAGCKRIGSYFFHDVDCYDREQTEATKTLILSKREEIGLRMLERSASGGWHLVCRREPGTTILENQVRVACALRIEMDTSAHDLQRVVFSTSGSEEDLVYLDDELFGESMTAEECEAEYKRLRLREKQGLEQVPRGAKKANKHYRPWEEAADTHGDAKETGTYVTSQTTSQVSQSPCITEATARTRYIFDECLKEAGLEPRHLTEPGGRHDSLKAILSTGTTQLLSKPELLGVLQERMPDTWQDDNIQRLVSDFYEKYTDPSRKMTVFERRVYAQSVRMRDTKDIKVPDPYVSSLVTMEAPLTQVYASSQPPVMPEKLPSLIALLTKNTPDIYKATVAHAVFPSLAVHLRKVQFPYTDNVLHEATLMSVAMAGTGGGKGCIDEPINRIMADIRERDQENTKRLNEYNDKNNRRGTNKDKLERPSDLVIQEIESDVTHAAFVQRLDEAQERFLYFKINEIEMLDKLRGTGGQQFVIICQAFDPGNRYGQTRAGSQSVNAKVTIRFNWNAAGTIEAVQDYFAKVLTKGPISRINFCTIPEREIGAEQPIYGIYDEQFDEELRPYIRHLVEASGVVVCKPALRLARQLISECAEFSRLSQDRVFENLSFRANVIAYLKACVLYVANGLKWEKSIEAFIRWSLHYDLWVKMRYFADGIRYAQGRARANTRGPRNLLALLPDEFTLEDAIRMRLSNGKDREGAENMLNQWVFRGYVLRITDYSFKKLLYKHEQS